MSEEMTEFALAGEYFPDFGPSDYWRKFEYDGPCGPVTATTYRGGPVVIEGTSVPSVTVMLSCRVDKRNLRRGLSWDVGGVTWGFRQRSSWPVSKRGREIGCLADGEVQFWVGRERGEPIALYRPDGARFASVTSKVFFDEPCSEDLTLLLLLLSLGLARHTQMFPSMWGDVHI